MKGGGLGVRFPLKKIFKRNRGGSRIFQGGGDTGDGDHFRDSTEYIFVFLQNITWKIFLLCEMRTKSIHPCIIYCPPIIICVNYRSNIYFIIYYYYYYYEAFNFIIT